MLARPKEYSRIKYKEVKELIKYIDFYNFDFIREYEHLEDEEYINVERIYIHSKKVITIQEFLDNYYHVNGGDLEYLITIQIANTQDRDGDRILVSGDNTDNQVMLNKLDPDYEDYYFEEI